VNEKLSADALPVPAPDTLPAAALESGAALARLTDWQDAAMRHQSYSRETQDAWRRDWQEFTAWCSQAAASPLPALPGTVAAFLESEHTKGRKLATVRRRAATIARAHRAADCSDPCKAEAVRLALRGIARRSREVNPAGQKQAPGLNAGDALRIEAAVVPPAAGEETEADTLRRMPAKDLRDWALLFTGRDLLARASELVSVNAEAITWDVEDGTAQVLLLRGKTHQEAVPLQLGPEATAALRAWLAVSGITRGPVFVGLTKGGNFTGPAPEPQGRPTPVRLTRQDVGRIIKGLAKRARLAADFSAHSLRVGMAQDMTEANISGALIMQAAGWQTPAMLTRYTRKLEAKRGGVPQYYARKHK
jgi:site-specific recombinase XerD